MTKKILPCMANHLEMLQQRQHILLSYFKTPECCCSLGLQLSTTCTARMPSTMQKEIKTSTSKLVARQSNLLNLFPYSEAVRRAAKLQKKDLSLRLALFIPTVSTNALHPANLFLFSRHHVPTNSVTPFSSYKYTHNSQFLQQL